MDSYDSDQRLILQGFSKSTRFAFFCASPNAKLTDFCIFFVLIFADFFFFSEARIKQSQRKPEKTEKENAPLGPNNYERALLGDSRGVSSKEKVCVAGSAVSLTATASWEKCPSSAATLLRVSDGVLS